MSKASARLKEEVGDDLLEAARAVARRRGLELDEWLDALVAERTARAGAELSSSDFHSLPQSAEAAAKNTTAPAASETVDADQARSGARSRAAAKGAAAKEEKIVFSALARELDVLESRLRRRGGSDGDPILKNALAELESRLRTCAVGRNPPEGTPDPADAGGSPRLTEFARVGAAAASQPPADESGSCSQSSPPLPAEASSSLLTADAMAKPAAKASPANAGALIEVQHHIGALAAKLDAMCRSFAADEVAHAPPPGGAAAADLPPQKALRLLEAAVRDATARMRMLGPEHGWPGAPHESGKTKEPEAAPETGLANSDPALALIQKQTEEIRALVSVAAERFGSVEKNEREISRLAESLERAGDLGAAAKDILRLAQSPPAAAALQAIEARFDALSKKTEEAIARSQDSQPYERLMESVEAAHRQLGERLEVGLAAASTETAALREHVEALAARINAAQEPLAPDPAVKALEAVRALEKEIAALSNRIEETRRLDRAGDVDAEPRLLSEIAALRASQSEVDQRFSLTLSVVNETISKVGDRLAKLEASVSERASGPIGSLLAPSLAPSLTPLFSAQPQDEQDHALQDHALQDALQNRVLSDEPLKVSHRFNWAALSAEAGAEQAAALTESDDFLIEPGTGFHSRPGSAQSEGEPMPSPPPPPSFEAVGRPQARMDFIAAARRAVAAQMEQQSAARSIAIASDEAISHEAAPAGARRNFSADRRRRILLGLLAAALAASAYALAKTSEGGEGAISPSLESVVKGLIFSGKAAKPGFLHSITGSAAAEPSRVAPIKKAPNPARPNGGHPHAVAASESILSASQTEPSLPARDLRELAENGDPSAQFRLGVQAAEDPTGPHDLKLAAQWYEKAARQGLAVAQYRLAVLFEKGHGVERDRARAFSLYVAAAEQGNTHAMHNLGVLAAEGSDGKPDYATAAKWFGKAAQYGVRDSQFNVAVLLARGLGAEKDPAKAYAWFAILAAEGDVEAGVKRDEVAARLTSAELAAAKAAIAAFRPLPIDRAANETKAGKA